MSDRTREAAAALTAVQVQAGVDPGKVGCLGFSQAGWGVPEALGAGTEAAFGILVGGAVNWEDQGGYYGRQRQARGIARTPMSADRLAFVQRNQASDARAALAKISVPFLGVFGAADLNVVPVAGAGLFRELAEPLRPENKVWVVQGATHGLLRAPLFNYQLISQWPSWTVLAYVIGGRYAFAPGVWDQTARWIWSVAPPSR